MIIRSISIRSKLHLITVVIVVILMILALIYMDASKRISGEAELLQKRSVLQSEYLALTTTFQKMVLDDERNLITRSIGQIRRTEEQLREILNHDLLQDNPLPERTSSLVFSSFDRLAEDLRISAGGDTLNWVQVRTDMELLEKIMADFDLSLTESRRHREHGSRVQLGIAIALGTILIAACLVLFALGLNRSFKKLSAYTLQLKKGILPAPLEYDSMDEFGRIAGDLSDHAAELQKKAGLIASLAGEGPGDIISPAEEDEVGNALVALSEVLIRKELDTVTRKREDNKQNWISEGMAQMGEILRSERENVTELSFLIVQKLVTYMKLEMGSLFITNVSDPDHLTLDLVTSYAYDRRKYVSKSFDWGDGLPGTCAQEKERIFLTDVPEDYFKISSGTGDSVPNCILLVPLIMDSVVHGVLELATFRLLKPFEVEFVELLSESITSSLLAVRNSERTSDLLKQSQSQAEELKSQDAALRENVEKLVLAQEEFSKKETEFSGILGAINDSSLVAEMGLNGRFSSVNDKFLMFLESPREQVVGKLHSEFAQVDPYSEEYKKFWSVLREGKSQSNIEMYKLFSGKEVWLQQTFTPVINNDGKVYKILNIATDITENRSLQDSLETREHEITRSGLEMQTLNKAVNTALIKCELDAEGIIMDVNDKYTDLTGYGRKELLGRNYRLFLKDPEKIQFEKIWEEVIKEKVYEGVIRRSKPTGEEVWIVSTFSPVKDEAGHIYKIYFMGLDITEKKLKYQLLEEANLEIERLKKRLES